MGSPQLIEKSVKKTESGHGVGFGEGPGVRSGTHAAVYYS